MKLVLFSDGAVGEKFFKFLLEKYPTDLVLVVTTQINAIYREAEANGIHVCVFDNENNISDRIRGGVDLGLLVWWPKILRSPLLEAPRLGFVNTHPSLLPHNRGKHPNFWAIVEQAPFGVSLHCVDSGVDTGPVVAQMPIEYDWCDTGETLYKKAQSAMLDLLCATYPVLRTGEFTFKQQNLAAGSFHRASELESASKINLDSLYRARDLLNLLRARTFEGYPGCWFEEAGRRYEISIRIRKVNRESEVERYGA